MGAFAEGKNNVFQHELLDSVADRYNKTFAQVILRWLMQREIVAIPKSIRKKRLQENFSIFDFEISEEDMEAIKTLDTKASSFFRSSKPCHGKMTGRKGIESLSNH